MKEKPIVLHCIESFGGGSINLIIQLSNYLKSFEHIVLHGIRPDEDYIKMRLKFPSDVKFIIWENIGREINFKKDLQALKFCNKIMAELKPDVVHLHSSKAGFIGRIASRLNKLHKHTYYNPQGLSFLRLDVSTVKRLLYVAFEFIGNTFGGKVVAVCNSEAMALKKYGIKSIIINNGIIPNSNFEPKTLFEPILIVNSGRVTYQKNPEMFNQIALQFVDRPNIRFIWIGEGELKYKLTSPNISITGWKTPTEVETILANAHIYLSTALWEGLPYSVLEAMNHGLPLVLNSCVGNIDLVDEGKNGYLVTSVNQAVSAIEKIISNYKKYPEFSENVYNNLRLKFDLNVSVMQFQELYKHELVF